MIYSLDKHTIRHLHSGQVITDIESIVKELIENSIDAQAGSIELKLIEYGLHSIYIKDDGQGIQAEDRPNVAKRYYTSKISSFKDIEGLSTYGFRGEAMNSICAIAEKVVITTKTASDVVSKQFDIDKDDSIYNEKTINTITNTGTIVVVNQPFYGLPVRRQLALKNTSMIVKRVQEILIQFSLSHPHIRFCFHQVQDIQGIKRQTWIKPSTNDIEETIPIIFGSHLADMLERYLETDTEDESLVIDIVLPKMNSDPSVVYKGSDHIYVNVNKRPIHYGHSELRDLIMTIKNKYRDSLGLSENSVRRKNPFIYLDIQLPPNRYDVNIEPNKTAVLFHQPEPIYTLVNKILDRHYSKGNAPPEISESVNPITESTLTQNTEGVAKPSITEVDHLSYDSMLDEEDELLDEEIQQIIMHENKLSREAHLPNKESSSPNINQLINWQIEPIRDDTPSTIPQPLVNPRPQPLVNPRPQPLVYTRPQPLVNPRPQPMTKTSSPVQTANLVLTKTSHPAHTKTAHLKNPTIPQKRRPDEQHQLTRYLNPRHHPVNKDLTNTLNEKKVIHCSIESLRASYTGPPTHHRASIEDYLTKNSPKGPVQLTVLIQHPTLDKLGLALFTRGRKVDGRHQVSTLGVVKPKRLHVAVILKKLIEEHKLMCKKLLDRPVQIQMSENDLLYSTLISLETREQCVVDDMRDTRVSQNGFIVRWRKGKDNREKSDVSTKNMPQQNPIQIKSSFSFWEYPTL
ncbi:hypothetical protein BDB01DRAFT_834976 [Pilobolus umbonatus]|nr:hypothetical protein BDB01DRAFT_834976 [Pilobolus umbonatus]